MAVIYTWESWSSLLLLMVLRKCAHVAMRPARAACHPHHPGLSLSVHARRGAADGCSLDVLQRSG